MGYPICGFGGNGCAVGGNTIGSGTPLATHKHSLENCGHELNPQLDWHHESVMSPCILPEIKVFYQVILVTEEPSTYKERLSVAIKNSYLCGSSHC